MSKNLLLQMLDLFSLKKIFKGTGLLFLLFCPGRVKLYIAPSMVSGALHNFKLLYK